MKCETLKCACTENVDERYSGRGQCEGKCQLPSALRARAWQCQCSATRIQRSNKQTMAPIQRTKVLQPYDFSKEIKKQRSTHYPDASSRNASIRTIGWNPLGTLIACGASDRTLRIWYNLKHQMEYYYGEPTAY